MMKIGLLVAVCTSLLLAGCNSSGGAPKPDSDARPVSLNLFTEPGTLDPRKTSEIAARTVHMMLFEGLTRIGLNDAPHLAMAASVEVSENQQSYLFHLRPAHWSDGQPVTAHDFAYAWRSSLAPDFPSPYAHLFYPIHGARLAKQGKISLDEVGVKVLADDQLLVELDFPAPYFLELVSHTAFFPVRRDASQTELDRGEAPGNGPFLIGKWVPGSHLVLRSNLQYYAADEVALPGLKLPFIEDENTELQLFEQGELDWAGNPLSVLPPDSLVSLQNQRRLQVRSTASIYWYKLNTNHPLLSHPDFRRALACSIDREQIIAHIGAKTHRMPAGWIPLEGWVMDAPAFNYHPDLARQYLNQALKDLGIVNLNQLTLTFNANEDHRKIAEAIQQQWLKELGIQVKLETQEWGVHLSKLQRRNYDIGRAVWMANFRDPINFLNIFRYTNDVQGGWINETGWSDPTYTVLLEQIDRATDPVQRTELMQQAALKVIEEVPVIPIYFFGQSYVKAPDLQDVVFSELGLLDFRWACWAPPCR